MESIAAGLNNWTTIKAYVTYARNQEDIANREIESFKVASES